MVDGELRRHPQGRGHAAFLGQAGQRQQVGAGSGRRMLQHPQPPRQRLQRLLQVLLLRQQHAVQQQRGGAAGIPAEALDLGGEHRRIGQDPCQGHGDDMPVGGRHAAVGVHAAAPPAGARPRAPCLIPAA
ncbi:MAG: hypothetical protein EON47_09890 [Acetobacteraceae bacterium]|nr:MAG: hypothetical protein EON47_09890 [Acetobacteraceae bacterium]